MISVSVTYILGILFPILASALPRKEPADRAIHDVWIDKLIYGRIVNLLGKQRAIRWATICYNMVFGMGDQQLTIAIALLVATLKKLHIDKNLSVYHLRLVVHLVYVSSSNFSYAVIAWRIKHEGELTNDARSAKENQHRRESWRRKARIHSSLALRSLFFLTLDILLLYIGWVALRTGGLDSNCPALCFRDIPYDPDGTKNLFGLWWGFVYVSIFICYVQVASIYTALVPSFYHQKVPAVFNTTLASTPASSEQLHAEGATQPGHEDANQQQPQKVGQRATDQRNLDPSALESKSLGFFVMAWRELSGVHLSLALVHFFFVGFLLRSSKNWGNEHSSIYAADIRDEQVMGFGQIVPLFLLIQPVLMFFDSFSGTYSQPPGSSLLSFSMIGSLTYTVGVHPFLAHLRCSLTDILPGCDATALGKDPNTEKYRVESIEEDGTENNSRDTPLATREATPVESMIKETKEDDSRDTPRNTRESTSPEVDITEERTESELQDTPRNTRQLSPSDMV